MKVLALLALLLTGCAHGFYDRAQDALNVTAVVVERVDDTATQRYLRAVRALGLATDEVEAIRAQYEPVRDALEVTFNALLEANHALQLWQEGYGPMAFIFRMDQLFQAIRVLAAECEAVGIAAQGLHHSLVVLGSILNEPHPATEGH